MTFVFGLGSCNNQTTEKTADKNSADTPQTISTDKPKRDIYIKDKSQYDSIFIDQLSGFEWSIKLVDNYLIIGADTTHFPDDLPLNKQTSFKAINDNKTYDLMLTRVNQTTLKYTFKLTNNKNILIQDSGSAVLLPAFFLAPEGDEDEVKKEGYGVYEYYSREIKGCTTGIRVEIGKDKNGKQRAKIDYDCNDSSKTFLTLDECPTLRTK
jgi:hypothetical protein